MTPSIILEKEGHMGDRVSNRHGFIVNVVASRRLSSLGVVGDPPIYAIRLCHVSSLYSSGAKTGPAILQPCHEAA